MPVELTHQNIRDLTKKLRELTGRDIKSTAILAVIADALGRRPDAMMHELKLEALSANQEKGGGTQFDFPHDPHSNYDHISSAAVRKSVLALISGYEDQAVRFDPNMKAVLEGKGGWMIPTALKTGAAFAFMLGIEPRTNYDAALVMQGLADYGYPSTGAVTLENKVPSPTAHARSLAKANGFRLWSPPEGHMVFGMTVEEVDLPSGDTAELHIMITDEGETSVDAGPNKRVWAAKMTYHDPRGSDTVAGGGRELSTLHEAIVAALVWKNDAERVWAENYDPDAITAFLARRRTNLPKP